MWGYSLKILCTGGNGFLGKNVIRRFAQSGKFVQSLDNFDKLCGGTRGGQVRDPICVDVTDYDALDHAIVDGGFTHIVHLAAYGRNLTCADHPLRARQVNVHGTRNLLTVARKHKEQVKRVVVCSSNIALSDVHTDYRENKRAVELEVAHFSSAGVSVMALRPSNIYGAGQSKTEYQLCAFAGLDRSYAEKKLFEITGDGTQTRDWVHAEDVARAFELALSSELSGSVVDVCTGVQTSMNEIAELLGVEILYIEARKGDAKALVSDPKPARETLHFRAELSLGKRIWDAFPSVPRQPTKAVSA